jgi:hypothetical protein
MSASAAPEPEHGNAPVGRASPRASVVGRALACLDGPRHPAIVVRPTKPNGSLVLIDLLGVQGVGPSELLRGPVPIDVAAGLLATRAGIPPTVTSWRRAKTM